jgi:hypothetical protein
MKFKTTESAPVRYEALPDTWVEYARPHDLKAGEIAVFKTAGERPRVYATIHTHAGGGCYAVELVVDGHAMHEFEERVFGQRIRDYARIKAWLLSELKNQGIDTRDEDAPPSPSRRRGRVDPEVRTAQDEGTVRMVGVHFGGDGLRFNPSGDEPR